MSDTTVEAAELAKLLGTRGWLRFAYVHRRPTDEGYRTVDVEEISRKGSIATMRAVTEGPSGQHYLWTYSDGADCDEMILSPSPVWPLEEMQLVRSWISSEPVPAAPTAEQKLDQLRAIVRPVLDWYEKTLAEGEPDSSYLYDTTAETFEQMLSRGDFQSIVEILRGDAR